MTPNAKFSTVSICHAIRSTEVALYTHCKSNMFRSAATNITIDRRGVPTQAQQNDHSSSRTKFMFANRVAFLGKIWIPEIECVHSVGYAIRHWFCAIQFPVCFLSKIPRWSNAYQWPLTLPIQLDSACQLNALGHTLVEFMFATWDTYNGSGMHLLWMTISRLWPFTK